MTFLFNSSIPGTFDAIFQATFLCALLLFWLCIYHGLRQVISRNTLKKITNSPRLIFLILQNERHILTFYLPKVVIVGMLWMSAVVMATWQEYNELRDPTYSYKLDTDNFYVRNWH